MIEATSKPNFNKMKRQRGRKKNLQERVEKYDARVFKTSMFGDPVVVFCGPAGNKFLFSNENKNVQVWWPSSVRKLLRLSLVNKVGDEAKMVRRLLMSFLNAETLRNYLPKMDSIAQRHIDTYWEGKKCCITAKLC